MAIVKINIKAIKFEDITVTFHPTKPKKPTIIKTEKKQLKKEQTTQTKLLKTNQSVQMINKNTPILKNYNIVFYKKSHHIVSNHRNSTKMNYWINLR